MKIVMKCKFCEKVSGEKIIANAEEDIYKYISVNSYCERCRDILEHEINYLIIEGIEEMNRLLRYNKRGGINECRQKLKERTYIKK